MSEKDSSNVEMISMQNETEIITSNEEEAIREGINKLGEAVASLHAKSTKIVFESLAGHEDSFRETIHSFPDISKKINKLYEDLSDRIIRLKMKQTKVTFDGLSNDDKEKIKEFLLKIRAYIKDAMTMNYEYKATEKVGYLVGVTGTVKDGNYINVKERYEIGSYMLMVREPKSDEHANKLYTRINSKNFYNPDIEQEISESGGIRGDIFCFEKGYAEYITVDDKEKGLVGNVIFDDYGIILTIFIKELTKDGLTMKEYIHDFNGKWSKMDHGLVEKFTRKEKISIGLNRLYKSMMSRIGKSNEIERDKE